MRDAEPIRNTRRIFRILFGGDVLVANALRLLPNMQRLVSLAFFDAINKLRLVNIFASTCLWLSEVWWRHFFGVAKGSSKF